MYDSMSDGTFVWIVKAAINRTKGIRYERRRETVTYIVTKPSLIAPRTLRLRSESAPSKTPINPRFALSLSSALPLVMLNSAVSLP